MPSFEIFTSPLYTETNGLVFSTKPLSYGNNINLFGLGFKNGAVNEILAQTDEDYELLSIILDKDFNSGYLGECALIDNSSPLFLTNTLYYETLYDENCSCHLALGNAFPDTIEGGLKMSEEELLKNGINVSSIHIDFMIGSDDLEIEAETNKGKKLIYSKGKYMI